MSIYMQDVICLQNMSALCLPVITRPHANVCTRAQSCLPLAYTTTLYCVQYRNRLYARSKIQHQMHRLPYGLMRASAFGLYFRTCPICINNYVFGYCRTLRPCLSTYSNIQLNNYCLAFTFYDKHAQYRVI